VAAARKRAYKPSPASQEQQPTHCSTAFILDPAADCPNRGIALLTAPAVQIVTVPVPHIHQGATHRIQTAPPTPTGAAAVPLVVSPPTAVVAQGPVQVAATDVVSRGSAAAIPPVVVARALVQAGRHLGLLLLALPVLGRVPEDSERLLPVLGRCLGGFLPQLVFLFVRLGGLAALGAKRQEALEAVLEGEAGEPRESKGDACGCTSTTSGDSGYSGDSDSDTASVE
jgi:hypothetical protein